MFFVYILRSLKDGNIYIGQTGNLEKRFAEHNSGLCKSTKSRTPFKLVYCEEYQTRSEAMKREKELKSSKERAKIKKLLDI